MSIQYNTQHSPAGVGSDVIEGTGVGLRVIEIVAIALAALLVTPPLLVVAVAVAVPTAVVATAVAVVAAPILLLRRVRAHHRAHGSTLYVHRLRRRTASTDAHALP